MPMPNLPRRSDWEKMKPDEKLDALYKAVNETWDSMAASCQEALTKANWRTDQLGSEVRSAIEKLAQRIAHLEQGP